MTATTDITAEQLAPGSVIVDHLGDRPVVTVLRWAEWEQDLFGRWIMRFWARRSDTLAEGYMTYGPGGFVRVASC